MRSGIKRGSAIESDLPVLPDGSRRKRTQGLRGMRDAASPGLFRGEWRVHGFRLLERSFGRSEGHGHRNGLDGKCGGATGASIGTRTCREARVLAELGLYHVSRAIIGRRTSCNATGHRRKWGGASPASTPNAGNWDRTAAAGTTFAAGASSSKFVGTLLRFSAAKNTSDFRAAGNFFGCPGSTQLLCGLYEKSSNSAFPDTVLMLLWSGDQLAVGHH